MITKLSLSLLESLFLGLLLIAIFLQIKRNYPTYLILKISLATGLGFGITSCTYFLCLILLGPGIKVVVLFEVGLLILLTFIFIYTRKFRPSSEVEMSDKKTLDSYKPGRILSTGFYSVLVLAFANLVFAAKLLPHGIWDAWAIWNLRARFIFRGGEYWRDAFSSLLAPSHHPDYPLLIPMAVSRSWTYIGSEKEIVPTLISLLFTFATAGTLYSALAVLRTKSQGMLANIVLLSTLLFINVGAWQQADIPTSFFFLACIALFFLQESFPEKYGFSFLAGTMGGFSGWTKNEGLLFLVSIFVASLLLICFAQNRKAHLSQLMYFMLGAMPVVAVILYFKIYLAPPNDLMSGQSTSEIMAKLTETARHVQIIRGYLIGIFTAVPQILLLGFYTISFGINDDNKRKSSVITSVFVILLMLLGYYLIYLITPYDLGWHLKYSLRRLLLQLWPAALFVYFMIVRTPEEALMAGQLKLDSKCQTRGGQPC